MLLAYQMTRSTAGVGLVTTAQFGSTLILGPWAGAVADRFDRRRVLIVANSASAVTAATMAFLQVGGMLTLTSLAGGALIIGVAFTFALPAVSALIPALVPEGETANALALNAASFNVGRALAPVIGVGVITTVGYAWTFALNSFSFVVLVTILVRLKSRPSIRDTDTPRFFDGLRIAARERQILVLLIMVALATVTTDPPLVLGPELTRHLFHVPETWSAYFVAALGTGTVLGSLLRLRDPSLRSTSAYLCLLGCAVMTFTVTPVYWVAIAAVTLAGVASLLVVTSVQTLLLKLAGPGHAGRIMAVWSMAFAGSRPIATIVDTWLAGVVGARGSAIIIALPAVALAVVCRMVHSLDRSQK